MSNEPVAPVSPDDPPIVISPLCIQTSVDFSDRAPPPASMLEPRPVPQQTVYSARAFMKKRL